MPLVSSQPLSTFWWCGVTNNGNVVINIVLFWQLWLMVSLKQQIIATYVGLPQWKHCHSQVSSGWSAVCDIWQITPCRIVSPPLCEPLSAASMLYAMFNTYLKVNHAQLECVFVAFHSTAHTPSDPRNASVRLAFNWQLSVSLHSSSFPSVLLTVKFFSNHVFLGFKCCCSVLFHWAQQMTSSLVWWGPTGSNVKRTYSLQLNSRKLVPT